MSFHLIIHAVCIAVIATLIPKYFQLSYKNEELEILYQSCMNHIEGKLSQSKDDNSNSLEEEEEDLFNRETVPAMQVFKERSIEFEPSQVEYFDEYLGTKSQDSGQSVQIEDYSRTQFSDKSVINKVLIAKSNIDAYASESNDVKASVATSKDREYDMDSINVDRSQSSKSTKTSVFCTGNERSDRFCHFENLCYHNEHKDFIFFIGNTSITENIPMDSQNILDLSSVADHTQHYFSFLYLPSERLENFTIKWINQRSLIFNKFKPDNIMHILHDDILPLHFTLKQIQHNLKFSHKKHEKFDVQLITFEDWPDEVEYQFLYDLFSKYEIQTVKSLKNMSELVCFRDVYVGISKVTTWYQYGFYTPQGPLPNSLVSSSHIHDTVDYILSHIDTECTLCKLGPYLVLLSRKETRRILNELDLSMSIAQHIGMKVLSVSLETHSLVEIINLIRNSKGLIGMHGSLLALAIFLQPRSILIELFPFTVNPAHYTPYKTLSSIPNMNISYANWVNTNEENTVMHPDWLPELGGISHLKNQQEIMNEKEVPMHLCCEDPSWLFHIYQDTIVDIAAVIQLIKSALAISNNSDNKENIQQIVAGPVRDLICVTDNNFISVKWKAPWNVEYIPYKTIQYQIFLFNTQLNSTTSDLIMNNSYTYNKAESTHSILVWVQCLLDNQKGYISNPVKC